MMPGNVEVVQKLLQCYRMLDADTMAPLLHAEAKHTAPGSDFGADMTGRKTIANYFRKNVFPSFTKVDFEIVHLWEDRPKNVVVIEWRSHLWPKTGKNYSKTGAFVIELRDGEIYWVREYFDTEKAHQNVT
jgi:ketosteroid isomerase-like protein